jgi:hypothetical protein
VAADGKPKQTAIRHNDRNTTTHPFMEPTNTNTPQGHLVPAMGTCRHGKRVSRSPTTMARQLGLAASENKKHLRQRTATIRREQTAKNVTNLFRNSNNPKELGFKHLVDIEGITGSKYDARNSSSAAETGSMTGWWVTSLCPSASTTQSSGIELRG